MFETTQEKTMSRAITAKHDKSSYHKVTAAVIGSGFGGLASAIRLQAMGIQTTCYEARDKPGGRAYVYNDGGFTFDAGPTVITAPHCLEELFTIAGKAMSDYVTLVPVSPFYRLRWSDGVEFDYVGNESELIEQIRRINPRDVEGYKRFADYTRRVFQKGYVELGSTPFLRFRDMISVAPDLMKLKAHRSVYGIVSRFIKDKHLRQAFSFHPLLVGGNPFDTSAIYTLIHWIEREWGVYFPRGGTGALVNALVRLFRDIGGEIKLNSPVRSAKIVPTNNESRPFDSQHLLTADGTTPSRYDIVVSNADIHHTYSQIYSESEYASRRSRALERMDWSMSLFVLYFGTIKRYTDIAHHTILFGRRFKGLLRDIFKGSSLPRDFSLYLHAPTITDESLAPEGCESFYVLSPVPHLGKADIDWATASQAYGDTILQALEEYLPGLRQSVVTRRHFTPLNFKTELNAFNGSAFSVSPKLTQSAYFRQHNRDSKIPGLYIVGAGTHPGAGVPGVVNTAKATCSVIAKDLQVGVL